MLNRYLLHQGSPLERCDPKRSVFYPNGRESARAFFIFFIPLRFTDSKCKLFLINLTLAFTFTSSLKEFYDSKH